jgi:uncharacterized protein (UPF0276 family)
VVEASEIRRELGIGLIYARELASFFDGNHGQVGVLELEPQTLWEKVCDQGRWSYRANQAVLDGIAQSPLPKLMHGIGQPLGGTVADPIEHRALLRSTADQLDAVWASEHLSFNRVLQHGAAVEVGFLMPPLQKMSTVRVAARNLIEYGEALGRPVAFETGANYLRPQPGEMPDGEFWRAVSEAADSGVLLDLHNLWCNELNGRQRVLDVIEQLPLERIWEIHLAGGMSLSGYWLDAHSDRIAEPLVELAAEVIPRLPNVGALMYELLPEHFAALGIDGVEEQVSELAALWALRAPSKVTPGQRNGSLELTSDDLATVNAWENSLYRAITGTSPADDPGIDIYRELVSDFRRGALARTMHYTLTLLLLELGSQGTAELLDTFFRACPAESYHAVEADNFARFLLQRPNFIASIPYLREVLGYEHALIRATVHGSDSLIEWTADPTAILQSLDRGEQPGFLPVVPSSMTVSASVD